MKAEEVHSIWFLNDISNKTLEIRMSTSLKSLTARSIHWINWLFSYQKALWSHSTASRLWLAESWVSRRIGIQAGALNKICRRISNKLPSFPKWLPWRCWRREESADSAFWVHKHSSVPSVGTGTEIRWCRLRSALLVSCPSSVWCSRTLSRTVNHTTAPLSSKLLLPCKPRWCFQSQPCWPTFQSALLSPQTSWSACFATIAFWHREFVSWVYSDGSSRVSGQSFVWFGGTPFRRWFRTFICWRQSSVVCWEWCAPPFSSECFGRSTGLLHSNVSGGNVCTTPFDSLPQPPT